jgi:hypothetical protein
LCPEDFTIIVISVPDPHRFGKLDPDPHQSKKQHPDPDPHQSEKVEALEGHFGELEGPNLDKSELIWIRIKSRKNGSGSVSR